MSGSYPPPSDPNRPEGWQQPQQQGWEPAPQQPAQPEWSAAPAQPAAPAQLAQTDWQTAPAQPGWQGQPGQPAQPGWQAAPQQAWGQPPAQQWSTPGYGGPQQPATNSLAVVSLITSLCGIFIVPVILSIVGIITGHMSLGQIRRTGEGGRGLAFAGLWIGYITVILALLGIVAFVLLVATISYSPSY